MRIGGITFFALWAVVSAAYGGEVLQLKGNSTFASREVKGNELRLWRASSSAYNILEISGNHEQAVFRFSGNGGAIGRISRISHRRSIDSPFVMSGSLSGIDPSAGKYLWGVYGWVLNAKEWSDATIRHEIYIVHSLNRAETDPLIGTLKVGDKVYKMHRHRFSSGGYRFKAVAENLLPPATKITVDLAPFMSFWKQHGLENSRYLHEVSWAVELLTSAEHSGKVKLHWHHQ